MRTPLSFSFLLCAIALAACGDDAETTTTGAGGAGATSTSSTGTPCDASPETCDGKDQDCDSVADDGPCSTPMPDGAWFLEGLGVDHIRGVAFDDAGNVYVTGGVTSPAVLDTPVVGVHGYVASLDPQGVVRWAYLFGGDSGYDYGQDVAVAGDMVCAAGAFSGPFDFGGGVRTTQGYNDAFVVCLDAADGSYRWDRSFGAALSDVTEGVKVAASGDVVIAGSIEDGATGVDFGGGTVADATGFFVARYGPDGAFRWVHDYPNSGSNFGASPGIDAAGNVYAVGRFYSTVDFGGGPRTAESSGAFVLALDDAGGYRWDHTTTNATLYGAVVQSTGNVVIGGEFGGTIDLGGGPLTGHSQDSPDILAVSYDGSGAFVWQYSAGGTGTTRGFGIAVGPADEIVLGGAFSDTTKPGDEVRTTVALDDMLAIGLTPDGKYLWDVTFGGPDIDDVNAVAIDHTGRVALGGETWGELELSSKSHVNAGSVDGALVFLR